MTDEIKTLLHNYRQCWRDNDAHRIESYWDTLQAPMYKAEEIFHIITDWNELRAYWKHNEAFNSINELSYSDVMCHQVSEGVYSLGLKMRWDIHFGKDVKNMDGSPFAWAGQAMGGDNHVLAVLIRKDGQLRFCSWVEAPDAPILYMAELYKKNVRADFPSKS